MSAPLKALTVYQPWATLIVAGAKPYEFRGWRLHQSLIGRRVVIHASARPMRADELNGIIRDLLAGGDVAASTCLHKDISLPILQNMLRDLSRGGGPYGVGLGTATFGDPVSGFDVAEEFGLARVNDSDRHDHANWAWPMLDIERWQDPMPMKGRQGVWNWPTPEGEF